MVDVNKIVVDLAVVGKLIPEVQIVMTAYSLFRNTWLAMNPGKTEDDFRTYLETTSHANIDDTGVVLKAHGMVETPPGSGIWSKA